MLAKHALYRLSYGPDPEAAHTGPAERLGFQIKA